MGWGIIQKRNCLQCKNVTDCDTEPYHLLPPTTPVMGNLGTLTGQPNCTPRPIQWLTFSHFFHVVEWPPWTILHPLRVSRNGTKQGCRSAGLIKTCHCSLNLFQSNACSKNRTQGPRSFGLTSEISEKFSHLLLTIQRWRWWNTRSVRISTALKGHISGP